MAAGPAPSPVSCLQLMKWLTAASLAWYLAMVCRERVLEIPIPMHINFFFSLRIIQF